MRGTKPPPIQKCEALAKTGGQPVPRVLAGSMHYFNHPIHKSYPIPRFTIFQILTAKQNNYSLHLNSFKDKTLFLFP
jgi:hypothetical protein